MTVKPIFIVIALAIVAAGYFGYTQLHGLPPAASPPTQTTPYHSIDFVLARFDPRNAAANRLIAGVIASVQNESVPAGTEVSVFAKGHLDPIFHERVRDFSEYAPNEAARRRKEMLGAWKKSLAESFDSPVSGDTDRHVMLTAESVNLPGFVALNLARQHAPAAERRLVIVVGSPIHSEVVTGGPGAGAPQPNNMTETQVPDWGEFSRPYPDSSYGVIGDGDSLRNCDLVFLYQYPYWLRTDEELIETHEQMWSYWASKNGGRLLRFSSSRNSLDDILLPPQGQGTADRGLRQPPDPGASHGLGLRDVYKTPPVPVVQAATPIPTPSPVIHRGDTWFFQWDGTDEFDVFFENRTRKGKRTVSTCNPLGDFAHQDWISRFRPDHPTNQIKITFTEDVPIEKLTCSVFYFGGNSRRSQTVQVEFRRGSIAQSVGKLEFAPGTAGGPDGLESRDSAPAAWKDFDLSKAVVTSPNQVTEITTP